MLGKIKGAIQDRLYQSCIEAYERDLRCQTDPYLVWVQENEQRASEKAGTERYSELGIVYMEDCGSRFSLSDCNKKYLLFVSREGRIAVNAISEVVSYFESHQDVDIIYADEDVWMLDQSRPQNVLKDDGGAHRIFPWTKPIWSPDTLFSFFYFGHIFAVRREAFLALAWLGDTNYRRNIYDFVLKASEQGSCPNHIDKILFHAYERGNSREEIEDTLMHRTDFIGVGSTYDDIRKQAMVRRGLVGKMVVDEGTGISYPIYEVPDKPLVSIVIPSKDNPKVLQQCIRSIYMHTDYPNFELIVIDNGSTEEVRATLENFRVECPFRYLYLPMDYNFSRMCNLGVKETKG